MNICKRCQKEFEPKELINYCSYICFNNKKILFEKIEWTLIQEDYNNGLTIKELINKYDYLNRSNLNKAKNLELFKPRTLKESLKISNKKYKHTQKTKDNLSKIRKEFLKNNPDKHSWKRKNKLVSTPCENLKKVLDEINILFISEYSPSKEKHYSVDIFLPHYKIMIEVNGNQHYKKDGSLKDYYQERHDFLYNLGYNVYEFHYSLFFDNDKIKILIDNLLKNKIIFDYDYNSYLKEKLNKNKTEYYCSCGNKITIKNGICDTCSRIKRRKVLERPLKETLLEDINNLGYCGTGRKYNVSDTCIRKWLKQYK